MDEKQQLEQLFKRWIGMTPSPRRGRAVLLCNAALFKQPKGVDLAWFDVSTMHRSMDREMQVFAWTMVGGFHTRLSGIYLGI